MPHHTDPFEPGLHTAHRWLAHIADRVGDEDRRFAYRLTRTWLHTVRDRIDITTAAHLSAQLPELWRGVFFEGWMPGRVPIDHHPDTFVKQFAAQSGISPTQVPVFAGLITAAFAELFSDGQLDHVFSVLPRNLVEVISGETAEQHRWPM
jgi:uncharacterized protein (DUF2267 family)